MLNVPEKAQNRFYRDIAPGEWMLLRHATHDKLISPMASSVPPLHRVRQSAGAIIRCAAFFLFLLKVE
jgi:hypothetical protein